MIIDDDLDLTYIESRDLKINYRRFHNIMFPKTKETHEIYSHGTICACIIKKHFNSVRFCNYKVFEDKHMTCKAEQLAEALKWSVSKDINVVHISLGSTYYKDFSPIKNMIDKLVESGKIIIAACSNKNVYTTPASLKNVIGVASCEGTGDEHFINKNSCDGINFLVNSQHELENGYITPKSNSCAAPVITAKVCKMLDENPKLVYSEIIDKLEKTAVNYESDYKYPYFRENVISNGNIELFDNFYSTIKKPEEIEVPLMGFEGLDNDAIRLLKENFSMNGFNCLAVSDIIDDSFPQIEYLSFKNVSIVRKGLKALNTVYNPDVILLNITKCSIADISEYIDLEVIYRKNNKNKNEIIQDVLYINEFNNIIDLYDAIVNAYAEDSGKNSHEKES